VRTARIQLMALNLLAWALLLLCGVQAGLGWYATQSGNGETGAIRATETVVGGL